MSNLKQFCIFSKESLKKINGIRGKMASQAGHAFLHSFWDAEERFPEVAKAFKYSMQAKKITLVVDTDEDLLYLNSLYIDICGVSLVKDAGLTVFKEPTITCLGIGPISEDDVGLELSQLKVLT